MSSRSSSSRQRGELASNRVLTRSKAPLCSAVLMKRWATDSKSWRLSRPPLRSSSSIERADSLLKPCTVGGVVTTTLALSMLERSAELSRRLTASLLWSWPGRSRLGWSLRKKAPLSSPLWPKEKPA